MHPYRVWLVALSAYVLAVFHRSSLAVAGLVALERFDLSASQLASFTLIQLLVYAGMQVPVGLLVDRFGPRTVLMAGAVVLTASQAAFALAETYPVALAARVGVGLGDSLTFLCVVRLVNTWFPVRRIPVIVQVTGLTGQAGALAAAVPMTWALSQLGWSRSYLIAAGLGVLVAVALALVVHDAPGVRHHRGEPFSPQAVRRALGAAWQHPGTRLGFWVHFTTQFSATTLGLLWGYPWLVEGEGVSPHTASLLLSVLIASAMAGGPVLGWRTAVRPWHRSTMALVVVAAIVLTWTVVLAWPGSAPLPLLVLLMVVVGVGGPASVIGFDLARTSNPPDRIGSATGITNIAGFGASLLLVVGIGVVLDVVGRDAHGFTVALSLQYVLWGVGLTQLWRYRVRARAWLQREDPEAWAELSGKS